MYLQQLKYPAVSLGHKNISEGQINEINKYCGCIQIYLMLDGDVLNKELLDLKKRLRSGLINDNRIFIKKIKNKNKDPNDLIELEIKEILE